MWETFSWVDFARGNSYIYQTLPGVDVCHISHSCIFSLYQSLFHFVPSIPQPLPIKFQTLTDTFWEI